MHTDPSARPPEENTLRARGITIHMLACEAPVRFAADELLRYLPRLLPGAELDVYLGPSGEALTSAGFTPGDVPGEGGILVRGNGRSYAVAGESPAAVLHAAYTLLEHLGARWLMPSPRGEVIRALPDVPHPISLVSTPVFAVRGLADGCLSWWPGTAPFGEWLEEMRALVDWMGKQRMNRLFVHFNRLPPGDLSPLIPELEKRGIELELGGHSLPRILPLGIREAEAELCRMHKGERRPDGNFCTSNPRLLRLLTEGGRRFAEQLPPARVYHLWPYDAQEDPWCSCPSCSDLSAAQQMWRAVAAASEGVTAVRPEAGLSGLLYHESLDATRTAPQGVSLLFAPRERCYLHSIDGDCPRNRRYARHLRDAVGLRGDSVSVLEYYGDPILLGRPANRPNLVGADLAAYAAAGVHSVSVLVFGALSWWLYPVQLYGYARGCWDPASAGAALEDYCTSAMGVAGGEILARYYRLEDEAASSHLRFCGYGLEGSWATLPFPPALPQLEAGKHLERMRRGEALLGEAGGLLERLAAAGTGEGFLSSALMAHRLEETFHRTVMHEIALGLKAEESRLRPESGGPDRPGHRFQGDEEGAPPDSRLNTDIDPAEAFAAAVSAMEAAPPEALGVFGHHWMLPWLRRCRELGHPAPL